MLKERVGRWLATVVCGDCFSSSEWVEVGTVTISTHSWEARQNIMNHMSICYELLQAHSPLELSTIQCFLQRVIGRIIRFLITSIFRSTLYAPRGLWDLENTIRCKKSPSVFLLINNKSPLRKRRLHPPTRQSPVGAPLPIIRLIPQRSTHPPPQHHPHRPRNRPRKRNPRRQRHIRSAGIEHLAVISPSTQRSARSQCSTHRSHLDNTQRLPMHENRILIPIPVLEKQAV